jgi:transposase
MTAAVTITRTDATAADLRGLAARSQDAAQSRRLLAIAMVLDGHSRADAARQAGMDRQTLRDWVHRYNEAGADGLLSRRAPGPQPKLSDAQMSELRELVIAGPNPAIHRVVRWRCADLRDEVARRFHVTVGERTIAKWLRKFRLTRLQPRPYHPKKDPAAEAAFKKTSVLCCKTPCSAPPPARRSKSGFRTRRASANRARTPISGPRLVRGR